jgi:hypothetical protein
MKSFSLKLLAMAIAMVLLIGCVHAPPGPQPPAPPNPANILRDLNIAVAATDALMVGLVATKVISADTAAQIVSAFAPMPGIAQQIMAELSSPDSNIVRAQKITGWLAPELALIDKLPPNARTIAQGALAVWQTFLAYFNVPSTGQLQASKASASYSADKLDPIRGAIVDLTEHTAAAEAKFLKK